MGLLKFIKKIFSKEKNNENNTTTNNNTNIAIEKNTINSANTIPYSSENINKNITQNNNINENLSNEKYLEQEKLLQLKYLNNKNNIIEDNVQTADVENISIKQLNTIWDILKIKENTQAEHIINSIPTDKWVTMDEIRHNIKLNFNVEYSNEKSLYPYLKTLTDINLIKLNNTGKKRTWKKNIIFIKEN